MKARENPFATHHLERLAFRFSGGLDWPVLLQRLQQQGFCGAIAGRKGAGKTTLLEELARRLEQMGFEPHLLRLCHESSAQEKDGMAEVLRGINSPGFALLDGAEQLSTRQWLRARSAASAAAGFVVTVHRISRLPVLVECETSVQLLNDLVVELTGDELPLARARQLHHRHYGNLREAMRELYDEWSEKEAHPPL